MNGYIKRFWLCCLTLSLCLSASAQTEVLSGRVTRVLSADRLEVRPNEGAKFQVRLAGLSAPHDDHPWRNAAHDALSAGALNQWVEVRTFGKTDKGAHVAEVLTVDGMNLNAHLVAEGLAWYDADYKTETELDSTLAQLTADAQKDGKGVWNTLALPFAVEQEPQESRADRAERAARTAFWAGLVVDVVINVLPVIIFALTR